MLKPRDRQLFLECLRPPADYRLDSAIGTSYSLDLVALLAAPLAFTFFDWEDREGRLVVEPLALLEAVRRHAGRIVMFCQAGEIPPPPTTQRLVAFLEPVVVEVAAPRSGGSFHPKIWLIKYVSDTLAPRFRLLCLSRNLTFDPSWDSVLCLEGDLLDRQRGIGVNRPLSEFLARLPDLAVKEVSPARRALVLSLAEEVRRVRFDLPAGVEEVAFWPLGLSRSEGLPFLKGGRPLLVMAPFLSPGFLQDVASERTAATLISRPDQLASLPPQTLQHFCDVYAFDPAAEQILDEPDAAVQPGLVGLHAKLFIVDDGWNAHVYTGSANATNAAFTANVEFLTELVGKKKDLGIAAFLGSDGGAGEYFGVMLQRWTGAFAAEDPDAALRQKLEKRLTAIRRLLASTSLHVRIAPLPDDVFLMTLTFSEPCPPLDGASLFTWPSTLRRDLALRVDMSTTAVQFGPFSLTSITGFHVFELALEEDGAVVSSVFALNLPLIGAPTDRLQRLLASMLKDQTQLLRLIWLLLQEPDDVSSAALFVASNDPAAVRTHDWAETYPVFERLMRCLADRPEHLREVGHLIDDLSRSPEGQQLLPPELIALWEALRPCLPQQSTHD